MDKNFAFFLPTRQGSERVKNKNTKRFAGIEGGLLRLKIEQLLKVDGIPIYVSTNDPETIFIAKSFKSARIRVYLRPEYLCSSSTLLSDLIDYVPTIVEEEHIIWVHVTEPFVDSQCLKNAIDFYYQEVLVSKKFDSLMSCNKIQTFLWDQKIKAFISHNHSDVKWPRSQDINPIYEINSAIFINSKFNYLMHKDRIGLNPYLYVLTKVQAIDIDWEEDFKLAEFIYEATR